MWEDNFKSFLDKLSDEDRKKALGVLYVPTMNHLYETDLSRPKELYKDLQIIGTDKELAKEALISIEEETFKAYGDIKVTESLNYINIGGPNEILAYYNLI